MFRAKIIVALLFQITGSLQLVGQCEDLVITDVSTWWECRGNGPDGYYVVQVNHVSWLGGTGPFTGEHSVGGTFGGSDHFILWESSVVTADGVSMQLIPNATVSDANGCEAYASGTGGIQYWVDPTDQVTVSSSTWDTNTGTANVILVDNPGDPGALLPSDQSVVYWLTCLTDPANDRSGMAWEVHQTSPERYELAQLPPGSYEFWLANDGPSVGSQVPCEGMAISFTVEQPVPGVSLVPRMALGGALGANDLMIDNLRTGGLLPVQEPYTALGYGYVGSHGPTSISPGLLTITGANAIVDWVVVELRSGIQPSNVLASRPALLQRDGDVVSSDGQPTLHFNMPAANYHVAVRHRNHIGVMTAASMALGGTSVLVDLTLPSTAIYGTAARSNVNGTMALWPGDATRNGSIAYTGTGNDRDPILQGIGGSLPTAVVNNVYSPLDINLDGSIRYTGAGNDRDIILQTIGGSVPTAVRQQQLP
ncbi:MAG: hypothetical protein IPP26_04230 [Flavobacteriales bacterium]|nr:hypothetical protein [Flavobacteriales bacterium]